VKVHIIRHALKQSLTFCREDTLRRTFYRWLAAKRALEHRRQTYQRKEALVRRTIIITAWERWREKFMEEKLQPLVRNVLEWLISSTNFVIGIPSHLTKPEEHGFTHF
jgi:HD superfamily phosphohydrolase